MIQYNRKFRFTPHDYQPNYFELRMDEDGSDILVIGTPNSIGREHDIPLGCANTRMIARLKKEEIEYIEDSLEAETRRSSVKTFTTTYLVEAELTFDDIEKLNRAGELYQVDGYFYQDDNVYRYWDNMGKDQLEELRKAAVEHLRDS